MHAVLQVDLPLHNLFFYFEHPVSAKITSCATNHSSTTKKKVVINQPLTHHAQINQKPNASETSGNPLWLRINPSCLHYKKIDHLPAVEIQHSPAKLPSKLHIFAFVDFWAQSLCSVKSDCASKLC